MPVDDSDSPLEFPCRFPIKVMGRNAPAFEQLVVEAVRLHAGPVAASDVTTRPSRNGRYLAVTVTFDAVSRDQVDAIYRILSSSEQVLFLL
jgi:putative lipoic acid-binding regulatory protein